MESFLANRPAARADRADRAALPKNEESAFRPLFESTAAPVLPPAAERIIEPVIDEPERPRLDEPQVEVIAENGVVKRIVVTCRCCEKIEIECRY